MLYAALKGPLFHGANFSYPRRGLLEMGQFAKDLEAGIDFFASQMLQPLGAEALDGERSHDSSIEQGALQNLAVQVLLRGEVAHESARERIARTGWVFHFFDGQGGSPEGMMSDSERSFAKENCGAIFPVLDDQR